MVSIFLAHNLVRKPVPTFRDHALVCLGLSSRAAAKPPFSFWTASRLEAGENQKPKGLSFVESHLSRRTRKMGHPTFLVGQRWATRRKERAKMGHPQCGAAAGWDNPLYLPTASRCISIRSVDINPTAFFIPEGVPGPCTGVPFSSSEAISILRPRRKQRASLLGLMP